jgi:hypothetical protein
MLLIISEIARLWAWFPFVAVYPVFWVICEHQSPGIGVMHMVDWFLWSRNGPSRTVPTTRISGMLEGNISGQKSTHWMRATRTVVGAGPYGNHEGVS